MVDARHQRNYVKTLARGLRVLSTFTPDTPQLTLSQLSKLLDMEPGTASRFVYTLEHLGYLRRDPVTRAYRLTSLVLELGRTVHQKDELVSAARPIMEFTTGHFLRGACQRRPGWADAHLGTVPAGASRVEIGSDHSGRCGE